MCKIYPVDEEVAKVYSEIRYALKEKGMPIPENDIWIMATAKHNGLIIVTRDEHILKNDLADSVQW